ncbi:MAG TPA: hypothetical protein VF593_13395 [Chthoniobacteraceae bacterium]
MNSFPSNFNGLTIIPLIVPALTVVVHIAFALGVWEDTRLLSLHLRRKTFLVGGGMWALATLLGGVLVAAIYWAVHHSSLRPQTSLTAAKITE